MSKNRGFTLVEVIGVIIILSLIMIVAVPSLTRTLKRNEQKKYDTYLDNVKLAAENHFVRTILPSGDIEYPYEFTLGDLIDNGYITEVITNPSNNNKKLSRDTKISINKEVDGTFSYDVTECYSGETCEE